MSQATEKANRDQALWYSNRPTTLLDSSSRLPDKHDDAHGIVSKDKTTKGKGVDIARHTTTSDVSEKYITLDEVARHNLAHDAWVVVEGKVYE